MSCEYVSETEILDMLCEASSPRHDYAIAFSDSSRLRKPAFYLKLALRGFILEAIFYRFSDFRSCMDVVGPSSARRLKFCEASSPRQAYYIAFSDIAGR